MVTTDTIFYNGNIITLCDEQKEKPEAILIRNDKIYATGNIQTLKHIAKNPQMIDLNGDILMPAMTDAHTHFVETAKQQLMLNMIDCKNDDDFYQRLCQYRENDTHKELKWIKGFGWEKHTIDKYKSINKHLIDKVFPDIPVSIASRDLHSNLCNSKALQMIKPALQTAHLHGIQIGTATDGETNGFLYENSWSILDRFIPEYEIELQRKLIKDLITKCQKVGLCGVHCMENKKAAELVASIAQTEHFYFTWYYLAFKRLKNIKKHFVAENHHFTNGGIKLFSDGSLGSDSAWMFEHQTDIQKKYIENIAAEIKNATTQEIQVAIHAIGDRAVYEMANIIAEHATIKHRIEHLQAVRPKDIEILKRANAHASMQPVHLKTDATIIPQKWTIAKDYAFPVNSVNKAVTLALGSDTPVETYNPFIGIKYATHRENFVPTESISQVDALKAYTYKPIEITNQKITYGQIKKDMIANIIVIPKDTFADHENTITETNITMVDGNIVHRK